MRVAEVAGGMVGGAEGSSVSSGSPASSPVIFKHEINEKDRGRRGEEGLDPDYFQFIFP